MKILLHKPTGTFQPIPARQDDEPIFGVEPGYEVYDLIEQAQPTFDPATQYLQATEVIDHDQRTVTRGWTIHALAKPPAGWPNVQAFMEVFTMQEKASVSLSADGTIAALRLTLSTWLGRVEIQDQRVQLGLGRMVDLSIISAERKAEIEAAAA